MNGGLDLYQVHGPPGGGGEGRLLDGMELIEYANSFGAITSFGQALAVLERHGYHVEHVATRFCMRDRPVKLVGPEPPPEFIERSDGCTWSPDGWWVRACYIHDWEYERGRELRRRLREARAWRKRARRVGSSLEERAAARYRVRCLRRELRYHRLKADPRLRYNMEALSDGPDGLLRKRVAGRFLGRIYCRAVRILGSAAARGPGHMGNWEKEKEG